MSNELSKAAKEARNQYHREWRRSNRDRVAEHQKKYWERRAAKEATHDKEPR